MHAMKVYGDLDIQLHEFLTPAVDGSDLHVLDSHHQEITQGPKVKRPE